MKSDKIIPSEPGQKSRKRKGSEITLDPKRLTTETQTAGVNSENSEDSDVAKNDGPATVTKGIEEKKRCDRF